MKRFAAIAISLALPVFSSMSLAQICDVTYSAETETMSGQNVGDSVTSGYALPMSEVDFYHSAQLKVLSAMSKEQDAKKDGAYRVDVFEFRTCDGGARTKIDSGSASIQGISYEGSTRIMDVAIQQAKVINDHHKAKIAKGDKSAWDHGKARKVKRDDLGNKVRDSK